MQSDLSQKVGELRQSLEELQQTLSKKPRSFYTAENLSPPHSTTSSQTAEIASNNTSPASSSTLEIPSVEDRHQKKEIPSVEDRHQKKDRHKTREIRWIGWREFQEMNIRNRVRDVGKEDGIIPLSNVTDSSRGYSIPYFLPEHHAIKAVAVFILLTGTQKVLCLSDKQCISVKGVYLYRGIEQVLFEIANHQSMTELNLHIDSKYKDNSNVIRLIIEGVNRMVKSVGDSSLESYCHNYHDSCTGESAEFGYNADKKKCFERALNDSPNNSQNESQDNSQNSF